MRVLNRWHIHVVKYDNSVSGAVGLWKDLDTKEWIVSREIGDNGQRIAYHEITHTSHWFAMKEYETSCVVVEVEANKQALWKMERSLNEGAK